VHDSLFVKLANADDDLGSVELYNVFAKSFLFLEDFVKFTSIDEWHHKVESCF